MAKLLIPVFYVRVMHLDSVLQLQRKNKPHKKSVQRIKVEITRKNPDLPCNGIVWSCNLEANSSLEGEFEKIPSRIFSQKRVSPLHIMLV